MLNIDIKWEIEKHEAILIALGIIIALIYVGEVTIDSGACSIKNPYIDCGQRGLIQLSQIQSSTGWVQTTGFGTHYVEASSTNGITFYPVPEFRNGYQHAVCDLGNGTCEYHFDTYNALDFPFGSVLHLADALTLYVGFFNEDLWQATIWVAIGVTLYVTGRTIEHKLVQ